MSIAHVMTVRVVSVAPDDSVGEAIRLMAAENIGAVAVTDGNELVGILTERDVLHLAGGESGFQSRTVAEVMTRRPACAAPDDDIASVSELMRTRRLRHVPVVEDGRLLGIVSVRDLLAGLIEQLWRSHDEQARETARALLRRSS